MTTIKAKLTFEESVLGTASGNPELHREFIASKSPDAATIEDEVAALGVDEVEKKEMTVFPRMGDGTPFLYDYQIKGFFKDACSMLNRCATKDASGKKKPCNESSKLTAFKKIIDGMIFVKPRMIPFDLHGGEISSLQRPLRAQTAQGERVALANSETVPAGSSIEIEIKLLSDDHEKAVREWLDYGELRGIGQWRNAGYGRFSWEEVL